MAAARSEAATESKDPDDAGKISTLKGILRRFLDLAGGNALQR